MLSNHQTKVFELDTESKNSRSINLLNNLQQWNLRALVSLCANERRYLAALWSHCDTQTLKKKSQDPLQQAWWKHKNYVM